MEFRLWRHSLRSYPDFHVLLQPLTNGTTQNYTLFDIIIPKSRKTDAIRSVVLSKMEELIELVRGEPCLYDATLAGYSDQHLINNTWDDFLTNHLKVTFWGDPHFFLCTKDSRWVLVKPLSTHNDGGRSPSSGYKFVGPGHPSCRTHGMPIAYDYRIRLIVGLGMAA